MPIIKSIVSLFFIVTLELNLLHYKSTCKTCKPHAYVYIYMYMVKNLGPCCTHSQLLPNPENYSESKTHELGCEKITWQKHTKNHLLGAIMLSDQT